MRKLVDAIARKRFHFVNFIDFVAEIFHADRDFGSRRGEYFQRVAAHAEGGTAEVRIGTGVLQFHKFAHQRVARVLHAGTKRNRKAEIFFGRAQAVDAGYRSHHDDVFPLHQGAGGAVAEFIDFVVHRQIFFDIGIGGGNVAFRLIIIVIRNEIFHAVFREKFAEFVAKLRGKRFIVRDYQRGTIDVFDDVCHRKRFAAARYAD